MNRIIVGFSFVFLIFSCKTSTHQRLENGKYEIISINGKSLASDGLFLKINLRENQISGKSACNDFSSQLKLKDGEVKFSPVVATKKMCGERKMETEQNLFNNLEKVSRFQQKKGKLLLQSAEGKTLITTQKRTKLEQY